MKRSLLAALIACAFSTQASAQSNVNLYGIVDAWVGQTNNKVGGTSQGATGTVESGGAQASRFGMRGSEDLGGGLKVNFILEQGISADTGTVTRVSNSNDGFNRAAYVGMTGGFGEVRLGRMLGAFDALRGSTNHLYDSSGFASTGQVWGASATAANGVPAAVGSDYLARGNNTIYYGTPMDNAFSGSFSYSFDENASTAVDAPRMVSLHGKYTGGPIRIGYGYQSERYTTGKNIFHIVAGNYDFGPVQMVGALQRQIDERIPGHQKSNEWELGLNAPFGGAYTVAVGYASSQTENSSGTKVIDAKGFSMMGTYDLSKRTRLYTAYRQLKTTRADGSTALDATRLGVGMTHKF
jgi:predicted porin